MGLNKLVRQSAKYGRVRYGAVEFKPNPSSVPDFNPLPNPNCVLHLYSAYTFFTLISQFLIFFLWLAALL